MKLRLAWYLGSIIVCAAAIAIDTYNVVQIIRETRSDKAWMQATLDDVTPGPEADAGTREE